MNTPDVTIVDPGGAEPYVALTLTLGITLADARALTGLAYEGDIAVWLAAHVRLLNEMLNDSHAREVLVGYLQSYADQDRADGVLPVP